MTRKTKWSWTLVGLAAVLALGAVVNQATATPASVTAWRAGLASATTRDGQTLAYLDRGPRDGQVIVLMHGLPTNSVVFRDVVPALTAHGFRVIAPDLVGFGASSKPGDEASYAFSKQAERVLGLLDGLEVSRFSLVVHDLGGLVSWELLERAPGRVERLLVLDTTAYAKGFEPPPQMRQLGGPLGVAMSAAMAGGLAGRSLTKTFITDNLAVASRLDGDAVDGIWWPLHEGATEPMRAVARHFDEIVAEFPRYQRALRRFTGPSLLVWGAKDRALSFETIAPQFAADLRLTPDRVRSIPDAAHYITLDRPDAVSAAIVELMAMSPDVRGAALGP